jgi:hypothetical protein
VGAVEVRGPAAGRVRLQVVPDASARSLLDFAYIDGDHTLRGITIDLIRVYPKVRLNGWIGGDDFSRTVWQHHTRFEPTLVFPFALYFAEAVGARIYALPSSQFLIQKANRHPFAFVDLTGCYGDTSLRSQFDPGSVLKIRLTEVFPWAKGLLGKPRKLFGKR